MIQTMSFDEVLVPAGRVLLMGSLGYGLIQSIRGSQGLGLVFERAVVGFIGLVFFKAASDGLLGISHELQDAVNHLGNSDDLKATILEAFKQAAAEKDQNGNSVSLNVAAVLEQAWRTGVWGVASAIVDFCFLISSFLLECAQQVLWKLLMFVFPLSAGVYPILPKLMENLAVYAVELSLWFPLLAVVQITTATVARENMTRAGSWGLYVVAIEVIAILLIFCIPSITHRFLSGAVSGDFGAHSGALATAGKVIAKSKFMVAKL